LIVFIGCAGCGTPTLDQLFTLDLHGMAKAFVEIAAAGEADGLGHHEWLGLLLDRERSWRQDKRLAERLRVAKLRQEARADALISCVRCATSISRAL
jgi:IstB-like ATP binding protein